MGCRIFLILGGLFSVTLSARDDSYIAVVAVFTVIAYALIRWDPRCQSGGDVWESTRSRHTLAFVLALMASTLVNTGMQVGQIRYGYQIPSSKGEVACYSMLMFVAGPVWLFPGRDIQIGLGRAARIIALAASVIAAFWARQWALLLPAGFMFYDLSLPGPEGASLTQMDLGIAALYLWWLAGIGVAVR